MYKRKNVICTESILRILSYGHYFIPTNGLSDLDPEDPDQALLTVFFPLSGGSWGRADPCRDILFSLCINPNSQFLQRHLHTAHSETQIAEIPPSFSDITMDELVASAKKEVNSISLCTSIKIFVVINGVLWSRVVCMFSLLLFITKF